MHRNGVVLGTKTRETDPLKRSRSTYESRTNEQHGVDVAIDVFDALLLLASVAWAVCATVELSGFDSMSPKTWFYMILFHAVLAIIASVLAVIAYAKASDAFPKHLYFHVLHNAAFDSFVAYMVTAFYFDVPSGFEAQRNHDIYSFPAIKPLIIWVGIMFFLVLACVFRLRNIMLYSLIMRYTDDDA